VNGTPLIQTLAEGFARCLPRRKARISGRTAPQAGASPGRTQATRRTGRRPPHRVGRSPGQDRRLVTRPRRRPPSAGRAPAAPPAPRWVTPGAAGLYGHRTRLVQRQQPESPPAARTRQHVDVKRATHQLRPPPSGGKGRRRPAPDSLDPSHDSAAVAGPAAPPRPATPPAAPATRSTAAG
jgi:hypothetical protein